MISLAIAVHDMYVYVCVGGRVDCLELQHLDEVKLYKVTPYEATAIRYGQKPCKGILELWYVSIRLTFLFSYTSQTFTD